MNFIIGLFKEIWILLNEMSPYLLFGFLVAGILHVFISQEKIYRHFSKNNFSSIIKASLFGIPLPLCSCGVIPVAAHLRKEGAGRGATLSFLTSTPTTGVDSIMATYGLLGPLFAVIRPVAALFSGVMVGSLSNLIDSDKKRRDIKQDKFSCTICEIDSPHKHSIMDKIRTIFHYGFVTLIKDVSKWLFIGIVVAGFISYFIPANWIEKYLGNSYYAYTLMILIAVPMYVCATGSIPIASSLIMKGLTPGAGLIFLIAGPATNAATLTFVTGKLGKRSAMIYLITIILTAFLFGLLVDYIWIQSDMNINLIKGAMKMIPPWISVSSSIVLTLLLFYSWIPVKKQKITGKGQIFYVPDITCDHCVKTITGALQKESLIDKVNINLKTKKVEVIGSIKKGKIIKTLIKSGYQVKKES